MASNVAMASPGRSIRAAARFSRLVVRETVDASRGRDEAPRQVRNGVMPGSALAIALW
jgi:hypothetical protein